jgi:GNAT superfamily N-acetyltransferase
MLITKQITDLSCLKELAALFDLYRQFYKQAPDLVGSENFLHQRITNLQSVIFVVVYNHTMVGFTQLYPLFSSVFVQHSWLLNDLYVLPEQRGIGAATALLQRAQLFAQQTNSKGLALETAIDNPAQKLYEKLGWQRNTETLYYYWKTT